MKFGVLTLLTVPARDPRRGLILLAGTAGSGKELMSMTLGQDGLNAGNNPILRILIIYLVRRIRERRRERQ